MNASRALLVIATYLSLAATSYAAPVHSIERAELLFEHGLLDDARREAIELVVLDSGPEISAKALQLLGSIELSEGRTSVAIRRWRELKKKYPDSAEAKEVDAHLEFLAATVESLASQADASSIAAIYLMRGDFWAQAAGRSNSFFVDPAAFSPVEAAVGWYDRVIARFPGTVASELAYVRKFHTERGWTGRGGEKFGAERNPPLWISRLVETYEAFAKAHPESHWLQVCRFEIAQTYLLFKSKGNGKRWLEMVIANDQAGDGFIADMARLRLEHL